MDQHSATEQIAAYLREEFGRVVTLREVVVERSASGRIWMGTVYCVTRLGDIEVGKVGVSESGTRMGELTVDDVVNALTAIARVSSMGEVQTELKQQAEDDFSDISGDAVPELADIRAEVGEDDSDLDSFFSDLDNSDIKTDIIGLLTSGQEADLLKARRLMPKLLVDPDNRGAVLRQMGELELRLGEPHIGLGYLDAAAREFADLADIHGLEQTAALAQTALPGTESEQHPAVALLEQTKARLCPIDTLAKVPAFSALSEATVHKLEEIAAPISEDAGTVLLQEGDPAVSAYVVQSGILAVSLESPGGGARVVRCCFPGELVGESSVLEVDRPTCNATVTVKERAALWRFDGHGLKELLSSAPDLKAGIEARRTLHRLDSFFSMNQATSTLDVRVRDKLLGCIQAIRFARKGEILEAKEVLPSAVYLVADGRLEYQRPDRPPRVFATDAFACLRDTLHELPLEGNLVAVEPSRLVTFDPDTLRSLAREAPPEVVAVLERLD